MKTAACALLLLPVLPLAAQVRITQGPDRVDVQVDGKPFTTLYYGADRGRPYLHPLRAASGTIVSRLYPMEKKAGESTDHVHHTGVWFSHDDVNGYHFWMNDPSEANPKNGKIVVAKIDSVKSGREGSITATFEWVKPDGGVLLTENRVMTFRGDATTRTIDFDITLTAHEAAKFGDTKEGTFAIRMADELNGQHTGKMTNAEGKTGEKAVWGKPSNWVDYSGTVAGEKLGIAIFDHASNPKHPTYWHSRDYGLFAANIFGERDFFNDKTRDGGVSIPANGKLRFRYRVIVHPGDAASLDLANLYNAYSPAH